MAAIQAKPTRMELSNLKKRKQVAVRGHKMMKDKRDELVRRFIVYARRNKELRDEVEHKLSLAMQSFVLARASMSGAEIEEALLYPARAASVETETMSVLSIPVPKLTMETQEGYSYPYGSCHDGRGAGRRRAAARRGAAKAAGARGDRKRRAAPPGRRDRKDAPARERAGVVMIPQFTETIRSIQMKLEENDRQNTTRLMKTKEMLEASR